MRTKKSLMLFFAGVVSIGAVQAADVVLKVRGTPFRVTVSSDGMLVRTWDRFT